MTDPNTQPPYDPYARPTQGNGPTGAPPPGYDTPAGYTPTAPTPPPAAYQAPATFSAPPSYQQPQATPPAQAQQGFTQPAAVPAGATQKSKVVAGVLGILLGSLGIHNFYLGNTRNGLIQLLVTVLTAGFLSWAVAIWGLVEGILILIGHERYRTDARGIPLKD